MKSPQTHIEANYVQRINGVFQFIEAHLHEELNLEIVAHQAHFSAYHFHRIFKTIVGETLNEYITRQRIEHAAIRLMHHEEVQIGDVAHTAGFSSNAVFTRAFKRHFGMSPTHYRNHYFINSKQGKTNSNFGKIDAETNQYVRNLNQLKNWIDMNVKAEEKVMPAMKLAYVTCMGVEQVSSAFDRLMNWAGPKGLLKAPDLKMATVYHDSFKTTPPEKVRMSAGLLLDKKVETAGEISYVERDAEKCLVGRFEIKVEDFEKAWTGMFIWMNEQGYSKADSTPYEVYHNDYKQHPEQKFILDICIPVK